MMECWSIGRCFANTSSSLHRPIFNNNVHEKDRARNIFDVDNIVQPSRWFGFRLTNSLYLLFWAMFEQLIYLEVSRL